MEGQSHSEQHELILAGMKLVHQRLLEFKRKVNSELVVLRDNKIVRIKP
jgi:hypothetical protein